MNRDSLSDLASCLQRQLDHYQCLHQLCLRQKEIVDASAELDGLETVVQEKQRQIEEIREIEKGRALLSRGTLGQDGSETVGRIRRLTRKIRVLLRQIVFLEEETQRLLLQRRLMIRSRLQQIRCWRRILRKYAPNTNRVPRFIDSRG
ncbi:MAG: flagellar export chaperone FlgN [Candidatus Latescibacteria bacterium]|nr:flagellar export chaperone FlgN [Candidatus Latescibacterota bacterium]